jgi:hypothetical protein
MNEHIALSFDLKVNDIQSDDTLVKKGQTT